MCILPYSVVLTFHFENNSLVCHFSKKSYWTVVLGGSVLFICHHFGVVLIFSAVLTVQRILFCLIQRDIWSIRVTFSKNHFFVWPVLYSSTNTLVIKPMSEAATRKASVLKNAKQNKLSLSSRRFVTYILQLKLGVLPLPLEKCLLSLTFFLTWPLLLADISNGQSNCDKLPPGLNVRRRKS